MRDIPFRIDLLQVEQTREAVDKAIMDIIDRICYWGLRLKMPATAPQELSKLVAQSWQEDPLNRPTFTVRRRA